MRLIKLLAELSLPRIIVLSLLATIAYYFTYFNDGTQLKSEIEAANATVTQEQTRRVAIEKTMKKEEEMRGNLLQLERSLEVVKAKIPFEFKDTQMSAILNAASEASGINVLEMSTNPPPAFVPPPTQVTDASMIRPEDLISEVRFNIVLSGSYESFLKFLDVLTKENKVIKVRNFTIEKNSSNIDDDTIKFKGEVVGFKQASFAINPASRK